MILATIGEWLDAFGKEGHADRASFAKSHPVNVLVTIEHDAGGATPVALGVESTAMFDPTKHKSAALASREAHVYHVERKGKANEIVVGRTRTVPTTGDVMRTARSVGISFGD